MENSDHNRAVDLLHKIVHNMACKDKAERFTLYQVYPLDTAPRTQHVPNVYKNHLAGLFYKLDLLYVHNKNQIQKRALDRWNRYCLDKPYEFNGARLGKTRVIELVIDQEMICASQKLPITEEEHAFLNQCRNEFLSCTETNDDTNANVSADTDANATADTNEASNKRAISPEPDDTEPKRTKVVTYGHKKTQYVIPRSAQLVSNYSKKEANKTLEGKERSIVDLNDEIEALKSENSSLQNQLDTATLSLQSSIDEIAQLKQKLHEKDKIIQSKDAEIQNVTSKVDQLECEVRNNSEATRIGKIMLDLPKSRKTWKGTKGSCRFYALACSIIPGASSTYLQMAIPLFIIAFLYDIGIVGIYDELTFVTNLCPSNKSLDYVQFIFQEFILTKLAGYFNKGAIASASHDKGERKGIGRLLLLFAFNNKDFCLDVNWWAGIISLLLNADGVKSTDLEIAKHIVQQLEQLRRSQPSKDKAKAFIDQATKDPYPVSDEIWNEMVANAKAKMRNRTSRETRKEQELATLKESIELNDDRKLGIEKGKAKDANSLTITELTKPASETGHFQLSWFKNKFQLKYFVEELIFRTHPGFSEEMTRKRAEERERVLKKYQSAKEFKKNEFIEALGLPADKKVPDKFSFPLISPLCKRIGIDRLKEINSKNYKDLQIEDEEDVGEDVDCCLDIDANDIL